MISLFQIIILAEMGVFYAAYFAKQFLQHRQGLTHMHVGDIIEVYIPWMHGYGARAARSDTAEPLYEYFNRVLRTQYGLHAETGRFGADMKVDFVNDSPVTIILNSADK